MQLQVSNSPFNQEQAELLNSLLPSLTQTQKIWLSGYLTASLSVSNTSSAEAPVLEAQRGGKTISKEVTILYGSQTGNAQGLAENAASKLEGNGFQVTISSMSDFKVNNLKKIENLLIAVSTHGEGDPPDNTLSFHEYLHGRRAPSLEGLRYSVLALGDSSYEFFCETGKQFDKRLEELGGTRLFPRMDCDLDYDEPASEWLEGVLSSLREGEVSSNAAVPEAKTSLGEQTYSRTNPYIAEVLENINLNGRGSNKETHHLELSLEGSGLTFEPGDSLGIYPKNDSDLVDMLLTELNWDPEETVKVNKQGELRQLRESLISDFEITVLTKSLIEQAAQLSDNEDLKELLKPGNEERLKEYREGRDLLDFIRDFGSWGESAQEFVSILRKMPARLYSIANSLSAFPDEVHLTIGAVRYESHGRERNGVCSILCADRLQPGDTLPVYIQHNQNFKQPKNPDTPIIMVGPGTGIAPFRSFIQDREESEAKGKTWLFYGNQHFVTDFLYQTEWQKWLKTGVLTKMDVAFSRDTDEKVYVQDRMREQSGELYEWLQEGAAVYICGDEKNMAHDVHNTLIEIIEKEGNMSHADAQAYLEDMQQNKRYQRDVY
ncbi:MULTISPECIES: assimilatory sulfite reductase (NADPH) flavoprotein subunit [unclassified Bacillus (in: firmicutes)]|uniref:assimilatory sulfite reductase (NADPH) flavoprotein subunit n=1 Tax=unclassified Bacillus (in: firmicutes) TaxID=185979 RepID=UPI001BEA6954|nr:MULTISPECIES: assimilatory sulfite reductase (NADPH) flavoprotein subunit [unclassified Bacillus (in: firmicutes)]MBT2616059.1 assimilatory sulfite reductase (NADPH) flavoprotein subunit [Bacillus sp. ISL-78]MBT2630188.1 assimilatory sulfite reductase (NADPH) flavoprotein subunit [Bacillus sp. ISL-101]MBT2714648.1 assimilatory sulfite reductase (NADPH) flavoprotein subunit [Bacillus sp. ISL-57]